ncbi:MAG: Crp/Fnr family transcriptional regulator [Mobilitalea sp.]
MGKMRIFNQSLIEIIDSPEYSGLLSIFHEKNYKKKHIIFHPNHTENNVFIVKKGRIRVFLCFNDKEFTLSILEAGDIFSTHTRAYTQALEDCTLLVGKTEDFGKIMFNNPAFTMNTITILGDLLKNSISIITNLVFKETSMRLKEYLLTAAEEKGIACEKGIKVQIGQDTGQIAMIIGASRQTVSTLMNELYRSEVLERVDRKTIIIRDIEKLKSQDY